MAYFLLAAQIELVEDLNLALPKAPVPMWVYIAAGVVLVGLLIAAAFWFRKAKAAREAALPPETRALAALAELYNDLPQLNANVYALRISQILRSYIEGQYGLRAPTRATEEFLAEAENSSRLGAKERAAVGGFLRRCDRVKFALGDLVMEGKLELHKVATHFVEETAASEAKLRQANLAKGAVPAVQPASGGPAPTPRSAEVEAESGVVS